MSINGIGFDNYSTLFSSSSSSSSGSSSSNSMSDLYRLLSSTYGVNQAVKTTFQTSAAVRTSGDNISSILKDLMRTGSNSLFNQISGVAENNKVASATVDGSKSNVSELKSMEVSVGQLATTQMNSGSAVNSSGKAVSSGIQRFEIQVGGVKRELSINVAMNDNNDDIQRKMVSAINGANLGVTAAIEYNTGGSQTTQTLRVTSNTTGNRNTDGNPAFSIRDTSGSLASSMGITNISREAQNAMYSINGGERQFSSSNRIELENGVTLNLAGEGSTAINFQKSGTSAIDKVKDLVSAMNAAMMTASESTDRGSARLFNDLFQMSKAYSSSLSRIGINVSESGVLTIDNDKLTAAAENGNLEKMFQGNSAGFANRLERISNNMRSSRLYADPVETRSQTPTQYYDKYSAVSSLLDMYF